MSKTDVGLGCSVVEPLLNMCEALGLIPRVVRKREDRTGGEKEAVNA